MNKTRNLKKRKIKKTQRKYNDVKTHGARKTKQNQIVKKRKISKTKRMHKSRSNQFGGVNDDDNELNDNELKESYTDHMQQYIGDDKKYDYVSIVNSEEYKGLDKKKRQLVWEIIMQQYIGDDGKYKYESIVNSDKYNGLDKEVHQLVWEIIVNKMAEIEEIERIQREQENCKIKNEAFIQESFRNRFETLIKQMNERIATANQNCSQ